MSKPIQYQVIARARDIIADPKNWTQGCQARDENNVPTFFDAERAVKWCAIGAVAKATAELTNIGALEMRPGSPEHNLYMTTLRALESGLSSLWSVNDSSGHKAVMKRFDKALEKIGSS